ncbi:MAG: hypothetical protein AAF585_21245, partial [Verrucomicrobiota bacterium]
MKGSEFDQGELLELIADVLDGYPDDATRNRLDEILSNSKDARLLFREHMELHADLHFDYTGGFGAEAMPEMPAPRRAGTPRPVLRPQLLAFAAMLVAALFLSILLWPKSGSSYFETPIAADGIAVISRALNVECKEATPSFQEGEPL